MNEKTKSALKTLLLSVISAVVSFITAILTNGGLN